MKLSKQFHSHGDNSLPQDPNIMANSAVAKVFYEVSKLSKYEFEPYWPEKKLRICVTGAGVFIASHLAKRLKSEGHFIVGGEWKRNEHMPVRAVVHTAQNVLAVQVLQLFRVSTELLVSDTRRKPCFVTNFIE